MKYVFTFIVTLLTLPALTSAQEFNNPLRPNLNSVEGFIEALVQAAAYILFPVAILFVVYSGFKFVMAQGNSEQISQAKSNFFWTLVGVALILGAWALAALVRGTVDQITN